MSEFRPDYVRIRRTLGPFRYEKFVTSPGSGPVAEIKVFWGYALAYARQTKTPILDCPVWKRIAKKTGCGGGWEIG
jgi:hypothetical protein